MTSSSIGSVSLRFLALALTLTVVSPAFAQQTHPADEQVFTWEGSFFTRYEARRDYGPETDLVASRARLGVEFAPIDIGRQRTLAVRFVPQAAGAWHAGGDTLDDADLALHEAYVRLAMGPVGLDLGRMELAYGDHLVLGDVGWHPIGRSFDALRLRLGDAGALQVDVFGSLVREGVVDGTDTDKIGAGDLWLSGVYAGLGPAFRGEMALDVYALSRIQPVDGATPTTAEFTLGVRTRADVGRFDYRAEAGVQLGRHPETPGQTATGWQGDGEVGVRMGAGGATARFGLAGFTASGDDPATQNIDESWNQLYPTAHKWLGYMDAVGPRSNIAGGAVLVSAQPVDPVTLYVHAHAFHQLEDGVTQRAGAIGNEVDVGVRYAIGAATGARAGYGVFVPSGGFAEDALHFVELELRTELP